MDMPQALLHCSPSPPAVSKAQSPTPTPLMPQSKSLLSSLAPLALAMVLSSPSPLPSMAAAPFPSSTPYTQSQKLQLGLENGKIRPCPATNPGCVSTNPNSSSFTFPWMIPDNYSGDVVQNLRDAILKTQRNSIVKVDEGTPDGQYLQVEVDGGFGRDVMEFLVKRDVVVFRSMARKVIYIYPFTTAVGDSRGQIERVNRIREELGWYDPSVELMD